MVGGGMRVWQAIDAVTDRFTASMVTTLTWDRIMLSESECHLRRPGGWVAVSGVAYDAILVLRGWTLTGDEARVLGVDDPLLPEFPGSRTPMDRVWMRTLVRTARDAQGQMTDDLVTQSARFRKWLAETEAARPDQKTRALLRHLFGLQPSPSVLFLWNAFRGVPGTALPTTPTKMTAEVTGLLRFLPAFREAMLDTGSAQSTVSRWVIQVKAAVDGTGDPNAQGVLRFRAYLGSLDLPATPPSIPAPAPPPGPYVLPPPPVSQAPVAPLIPPPPPLAPVAPAPALVAVAMPPLVPFLDRLTLGRAAVARETLMFSPKGIYVVEVGTDLGRRLSPEESTHLRQWIAWANDLGDTTDGAFVAWVKADPKAPTFGKWTEWNILGTDGHSNAVG